MTIPEPRPLPPPVAGPVPAEAKAQDSKPVQVPTIASSTSPAVHQPRKAMAAVPAAKPEPAMPFFAEAASEEAVQPEPRKSAFKKNEGAAREWKPVD